MKYGKCQWARVSSLLPRKTAKQCKARWYEWLDPSIKKTEWSREEEERLLHLAKLMPSQWRTIAPLVGRTAAQCLEHYEKLLDMAQDKEAVDPRDDPRRLQPGEIDPAPETRPARPDPVDMDEDEKEMLSEARARLANTKGKKAKRKAREKQLEEAKRLAALQKRRELVAAGIEVTRRKVKRNKGIDYATEIPFQKLAPAGVYDISEEDRTTRVEKQSAGYMMKRLNEIEEQRREEEEERERAKDKRKFKRLGQANLSLAIQQTSALNDPSMARKRSKLDLPAPQVSDAELVEIAKAGAAAEGGDDEEDDGTATRALVGVYAAAALPTPMRTPRLPPSQDVIMEEARNLVALNSAPTPLKGGANPELSTGTGFQGVTPLSRSMATPNPLLDGGSGTPLRTPLAGSYSVSRTPLRDQLSINAADDTLMDRLRQKALAEELRASLRALPEPQFSYDMELPEVEEDMDTSAAPASFVEDAADVDRRNAAALAEQAALEFARRSSALKREPPLPRVTVVDEDAIACASSHADASLAAADTLIKEELVTLLQHDAVKFPTKSKPSRHQRTVPPLVVFTDDELALAAAALAAETLTVQAGVQARCGAEAPTASALTAAWVSLVDSHVFVPSLHKFMLSADLTPQQAVESARFEFERVVHQLEKEMKKVNKAEAKIRLLTAGFEKRAGNSVESIQKSAAETEEKSILLSCYKALRADELNALPQRLSAATAELQDATEKEAELQAQYARLAQELDDLKAGRVHMSSHGTQDVSMD